jgi:catechol 2,3-dioxygenase-like lactoylglutathione lyase family enzyme
MIICSLQGIPLSAQQNQKLQPYLSGIMTTNASRLQQWYTQHLGFQIKDERNIPASGIHFFLLEHEGFLLEIIQRNDLFDPQPALDSSSQYKFVRGLFKVGFYVSNIEEWFKKLQENKVTIKSENVSTKSKGPFILLQDPDGNLVQLFEQGR